MDDSSLNELEQTLHREMPICVPMAIRPVEWSEGRLSMQMPLEPNRNHQYSAFAGSLNALCTISGWGAIFLLLRGQGLAGNIVIRRSQIRYFRPVRAPRIVATTRPADASDVRYFFELLREKGSSKLDVGAEISDAEGTLVSFAGSYVVQE